MMADLFGAIAFLAFMGWGVTLALLSRNHFREAQALEIEERVNARIDDRVGAVINRYRALKAKGTEGGAPEKTVLDDATEAEREKRRQKFMTSDMPDGDTEPFDFTLPLDGQPLSSVE